MESSAIERQFSRAGKSYEDAAGIQRRVAAELVKRVTTAKRVLEIGAGTGFATRALAEKVPSAQITALDLSSGMLDMLRRRLNTPHGVELLCGDFMNVETGATFDLILSSSCLQWVAELDRAFARMRSLLEPGGSILAAIMVRGTLGELHELRGELYPALRPRRELPERERISEMISRSGLRILEMTERTYREEVSDAWALFRRLQAAGLTGGELSLGARPLMRRELARLAEAYNLRYPTANGSVSASYRVLFVEARKDGEKINRG